MRLGRAANAPETGVMHNTVIQAEAPSAASTSQQMIQLTSGHIVAQALYVVAELGLADLLATEPRSVAEACPVKRRPPAVAIPSSAHARQPRRLRGGRQSDLPTHTARGDLAL